MKIVCTHCQTGYQVARPEVKSEGIEFKCAKCGHFFLITPKDVDQDKSRIYPTHYMPLPKPPEEED